MPKLAGIEINRLVYIDETGVDNNMSKLRGWAEKGNQAKLTNLLRMLDTP